MQEKLLTFEGKNERGIFTYLIDADRNYLEKTASEYHPTIASYIHDAKSIPNMMQVLITALGAGEWWGCFLEGAPVLLGDGSEKAIEKVEAGDLVWTHKNRPRSVVAPTGRHYSGDIYSFSFRSWGLDLECTDEHPLYGISKESLSDARKPYYKQKETYDEFMGKLEYGFRPARECSPGDYICVPFPTETVPNKVLSQEGWDYLMGWYLAEGTLVKNYQKPGQPLCKVIWTLGGDEEDVAGKIAAICKEAGHETSVQKNYGGCSCIRVEVTWSALANACAQFMGAGSKGKKLSTDILVMPREWQLGFLSAYLDGDGCQTKGRGRYHGSLRSSTVSKKLSSDLCKLTARLGYSASFFKCRQHHSCNYSAGSVIYENSYARDLSTELSVPSFEKVSSQRRSGMSTHVDKRGYLLVPISSVSVREYEGPVYNLEVEDDNSYCVNSFAVHNSNVNGDYFPEEALAHEGADYGYKTFETEAKVYKHHINKDPTRSYGDVLLSVYNPTYHRVELILGVNMDSGRDISDRIENGEYLDWSMGCFPSLARVLMKDGTEKFMLAMKAGDEIINGMGGAGKVARPHSHHHTGTWHHVKTLGLLRDPEKATEEHPWYVIPKEQVECIGNPNNKSRKISLCFPNSSEKKVCTSCPNGKERYNPEWKRSDELKIGDYIATPAISLPLKDTDNDYAFLSGHYVANGYAVKSYKCILLTVNNAQLYLEDDLKRRFPEANIYSRPRANSDQASDIYINDKNLYNTLVNDFGRVLSDKSIFKVFEWSEENQKIFLGALIDGDGGEYKNALYISTSKELMAYHLQMMLAGVGCVSSVNTILHKPSTIVDKDTVEYQVWLGQDSAYLLSEYTNKGSDIQKPKMFKNHRFISNGFLWSPILSITTEDCDEEVYNVEVESGGHDTDSYVINGVSLHNCKVPYDTCNICGNRAPTRREYCEHAKYYLNKIWPDTGQVVYVINSRPKFHDISQVLIGADRIAKTLMKVASRKSFFDMSSAIAAEKRADSGLWVPRGLGKWSSVKKAVDKKATMSKRIPAEPPASVDAVRDLASAIMETKAREKPLPRPIVDELGSMPLRNSLSTLGLLGILPKPQEFQRIVLISIGRKELADELDSKNLCFDPMDGEPTEKHEHMVGVEPSLFSERAFDLIRPFMAERSYASPHLGRRLTVIIKRASEMPPNFLSVRSRKDERTPLGIIPVLLGVAGLYAAFAGKSAHGAPKNIDNLMLKHPGVAAAVGLSLVTTAKSLFGSSTRGNYSKDIDVKNDVWSRIDRLKTKPFEKEGAFNLSPGKRLFIGAPSAYIASDIMQKRIEQNPYAEEGAIRKFIRKNPDIITGALAADAYLSMGGKGSMITKGMNVAKDYFGKGVKNVASFIPKHAQEDFFKTADVVDFLASSVIYPLAFGTKNLPARVVGGLIDQAALEIGSKYLAKKQQNHAQSLGLPKSAGVNLWDVLFY